MQKANKFKELIQLQESSGLSAREFCFNEGIAPSTFYYWRKKLQRREIGKKDFIPLLVKPPGSSLPQGHSRDINRKEYQPGQMAGDNTLLELIYPNGTLLRIKEDLDLAHLRALIHLYDR